MVRIPALANMRSGLACRGLFNSVLQLASVDPGVSWHTARFGSGDGAHS